MLSGTDRVAGSTISCKMGVACQACIMGVAGSDSYVCGVVAALHSSRVFYHCIQRIEGPSLVITGRLQQGEGERGKERIRHKNGVQVEWGNIFEQ